MFPRSLTLQAQTKGRSGPVWCLLSLLIGPFAAFLIVVLDKGKMESECRRHAAESAWWDRAL